MTDKPRDVQVLPIAENTRILRSRTWGRLRFEIEYARQRGTTANTYLIESNKIALIDPPGESFTPIFIQTLKDRVDISSIDYVILGHVNPNRAVTLKALLEIAPKLTFVCSNPGAIALRSFFADEGYEAKIKVMRGEETFNLGQGHRLLFTPMPTPRWSDGLATYDTKTQILYTDKFFGAHVCGDQVFDEGSSVYANDRRYYFDCLMAPNARQVATSLEKLASLPPIRFYAPAHGPIVRDGMRDLTDSYRRWSQEQQEKDVTVALLFASAYGNTATIGQAIARGLTKAGVSVEAVNCEVTPPDEIQRIVENCSGFIIGSPTLGGHAPTQIQTALGIVLSTVPKTTPAAVFGSFGWSGEAIDLLESKLRNGGYQLAFDPIRVKFKPTEVILKTCEEAGTDFAQTIRKAKKVRSRREPASNVEQAIGRLVGSLCVLTTKQGDLSSAMLASWVSQATFSPPGLTVAVAKERAIESLLYQGSPFALNILGEGKHLGLMKHFLKPFNPGEDRFAGVEARDAENGSPILQEAIATLECTVQSRMECGDHWLVYATVAAGNVSDANTQTAVHHRKTGTHY